MATQSSILAWEILAWTENLAGYSTWGLEESERTKQLTLTNQLSQLYAVCIHVMH